MTDHDHDKPKIDAVTGIVTTGHDWDGVTELNQPLPRWWLWIFYATIVFAVGYWVVYPSWPLVSSYASGVLGWHSRTAVVEDVAQLVALRGPMVAKLTAAPLADVEKDNALLDFSLAYGRAAFRENCAPCHGAGGGGAIGYPNLIDDDWLWGGTADAISTTITHGIRNDDEDSRQSQMPAFGKEGTLKPAEIQNVAAYVRSLSALDVPADADLAAGAKLFADNCASCHGAEAKGNRDIGAPNLTDAVWLYGSSQQAVVTTITNARNSSMPSWSRRLDPTTIKALTLYVHSLGGGE
jgi:cytochrome c oxidase cbb3-type subunit 3